MSSLRSASGPAGCQASETTLRGEPSSRPAAGGLRVLLAALAADFAVAKRRK